MQKPISDTKEISLPHEYNVISLNFVALNYTSGVKDEYLYMLKGFDKDWVRAGKERMAHIQIWMQEITRLL